MSNVTSPNLRNSGAVAQYKDKFYSIDAYHPNDGFRLRSVNPQNWDVPFWVPVAQVKILLS